MQANLLKIARTSRRGSGLVEIMLVTAILGLLICLLLPAIEAAREVSRNNQCKNHLRRIGRACLLHENTFKVFPYGGWSFGWMGDPDQGVGPKQPGGWIYAIAPYLEDEAIARIGAGLTWYEKKQELAKQIEHVIPEFYCPSRRPPVALSARAPNGVLVDGGIFLKNAIWPEKVAKTDYAINGGTTSVPPTAGGSGGAPSETCLAPGGGVFGDDPDGSYPHCDWHCFGNQCQQNIENNFNGISTWRLAVRVEQIIDGTKKTILAGDKSMFPFFYNTPGGLYSNRSNYSKGNGGDNGTMYGGYDFDQTRWGKPARDSEDENSLLSHHTRFGSAHPDGANFVFCNGSVKKIDYDVSPGVWYGYVGRSNGEYAPPVE